nr:hypothetical protein [Tanacetum cinerariifolium]
MWKEIFKWNLRELHLRRWKANGCEGMLRGGFCLPCDLKAENSFICDQNAYSFNDLSNNLNYLPQPRYENYLCNLYGNNSHDGYDCQQQFLFVYEQEPSCNQNYDVSTDGPKYQFFGSDQIQTPRYPDVHPPSQEINNEVFQANHSVRYKENQENSSNSNQEKEGPPQDSDIRQLIREECSVKVCEEQKQSMEDTMLELVKNCRQKEFLCIHDNIEDLIKSALNTKLLSINSQRLEKKQQEVKNVVEQPAECRNLVPILSNKEPEHSLIVPILSNKEPEHSLSMGYEHLNITPETESDEVTEFNAKNLLAIPSECEVTSEDEKEEVDLEDISQIQDVVLHEKLLSINHLIANIESLNDNPTPDCVLNSFKSDNSLSDKFSPEFKTFCDHTKETRSDNTNTHADNSLPEYDSFCFEIEPDQERLINLVKNDISDNSSNDPLLEEADLFLASDNSIPPDIENVADDPKGDVRFLEELL